MGREIYATMKMLTVAAALAAVLVSTGAAYSRPASTAPATSQPQSTTQGERRGQFASNRDIREAHQHVDRAIDRLQHDAEDYGGHRVAAVEDLQQANQALDQALSFVHNNRNRNGNGNGQVSGLPIPGNPSGQPVGRPVSPSGTTGGSGPVIGRPLPPGTTGTTSGTAKSTVGTNEFERGQVGSNENLENTRREVEAAIDSLNRDASDYGGFKAQAIDRLQAARSELDAALDFVHQRGVQNGGGGQRVSDANLQFVKENVDTAISRLNSDAHDYGGHRVLAIEDLQDADGLLSKALAFDQTHDQNGNPIPNAVVPGTTGTLPIGRPVAPSNPGSTTGGTMPVGRPIPPSNPTTTTAGRPVAPAPVGGNVIGQGASNDSLADAHKHLLKAIDALQRDRHDYGGFRAMTIDKLQAARQQLEAALAFRHSK